MEKVGLVIIKLSILALSSSRAAAEKNCPYVGVESVPDGTLGKLLRNHQLIESWETCASLCRINLDCTHWTWHDENSILSPNLCIVLTEAERYYNTHVNNTISGSRDCQGIQGGLETFQHYVVPHPSNPIYKVITELAIVRNSVHETAITIISKSEILKKALNWCVRSEKSSKFHDIVTNKLLQLMVDIHGQIMFSSGKFSDFTETLNEILPTLNYVEDFLNNTIATSTPQYAHEQDDDDARGWNVATVEDAKSMLEDLQLIIQLEVIFVKEEAELIADWLEQVISMEEYFACTAHTPCTTMKNHLKKYCGKYTRPITNAIKRIQKLKTFAEIYTQFPQIQSLKALELLAQRFYASNLNIFDE